MGTKRILSGLGLVLFFLFRESVAWALGQVLSRFALPKDASGKVALSLLPWGDIIAWFALVVGIFLIISGALRGHVSIPWPKKQEVTGDTLSATAEVSDPTPGEALGRLLHTSYVLTSVQKLRDANFIELSIVAYNASPKTISLADVRGNARCTMIEGEKEISEKLGVPDLMTIQPKRQIPPFSEFVMTLHQIVSERQSLLIRGTMRKKTVTLDLRELRLEFEPYQEPGGPRARLKLWDGVGISEANGPRLNRIAMMQTGMSLGG